MQNTYTLNLDMKPLIGRENGKNAAQKANLKEKEKLYDIIEVHIPVSTYAMSSSFFLGFFAESAQRMQSKTDFLAKYKFISEPFLQEVIEVYTQRLFSV